MTEVIVVDGGSDDKTRDIAQRANVRLLHSPQGRGQQLAHGAMAAQGEVLWFLHADTIPNHGAAAAILEAFETHPNAPGGNFKVLFDGGSDFADWLTGFYAWLRAHGIYYGDSAIFVRRTVYDAIGGIEPTALMEDYAFTRKLERSGPTLNITRHSVTTSSRRFHNRRPWRIVAQWLVIHAMYYCRASGDAMAQLYRSPAHSPGQPD